MERRRFYRKNVSLGAKLIHDSKNSTVFIKNLSRIGIFIEATHLITGIEFSNWKTIKLKFRPPLRETLSVQCEVKWSHKTPPFGLTKSIGLEIIDTPPEYEEFFKTV